MGIISQFHIIEIIICIWAGFTGWFYYDTFRLSKELKDALQPRSRKANPDKPEQTDPEEDYRKLENTVVTLRDKMNLRYSLFANFTSVLPLWGMLGTVVSLLGLAGMSDNAEMPIGQFFTALITTALGILFAIVYKALDSVVSVKVSANNKETDTLLDRNSELAQQEKEAAYEA